MDPAPIQLSNEAWGAIGVFVTGHLGLIWKILKDHFRKETEAALLNQRLDFMNQSLGRLEASQSEIKKDVDAAFEMIRKTTISKTA